MKKRRFLLQILALMLCAVMLLPMTALAEEVSEVDEEDQTGFVLIDPEALQKMVEDYLGAKKYRKDHVSIGYCYLDTGDTWYYNGDTWRYSAAMYRLPLTMIYAEKEYNGELTADSDLKGVKLQQAEENILVYGSNDQTYKLMDLLGSEKEVRKLYQAYSSLPEEYYDPDFYDYSYFTANFTTDLTKTLYQDSERFPRIIELLKRSDEGKYIDRALGGDYEVAQKTGVFTDRRGVQYNNVTSIVYTEHPFVLTIMLQDLGTDDLICRELATLFKDYTLSLDEPYAALQERLQQIQAPETEEPATEEPETEAPETNAPETTEPTATETPAETEPEDPQATEAPAKDQENKSGAAPYLRLGVIMIAAALFVILLLGELVQLILRGKARKEDDQD